jgi:integrase
MKHFLQQATIMSNSRTMKGVSSNCQRAVKALPSCARGGAVTVNPVGAMMDKPLRSSREARCLEVPDGALLLAIAPTLPPLPNNPDALSPAFGEALLATFLLTGARFSEVVGLELDDISFDRQTVTFRPNAFRSLKTRTSHRVVPLWPQLEEILRPWVFDTRLLAGGRLLFASFKQGREQMLDEPRKLLDRIGGRGGWEAGAIRTKMFRHT